MTAMGRLRMVTSTCLGVALLVSAPASLLANGRFPATVNSRFQPTNQDLILVPATFGLLKSDDGGASFQWICEDTVGYGGTYDPDYAITSDGKIYATTFNGLRFSADGGCSFEPTQFFGDPEGGNNPILLDGHWVGEIEIGSDGKIWAATSTGGASNDVYVSTDGVTFHSANNWDEIVWWKSLRVAPSSPDTVYVSGYKIEVPDVSPSQAVLRKTTDGGVSWTELGVDSFSFGAQPNLLIEAVSPTDPDVLYVRVLGAREPQGDDIYRSSDGGVSWTKVLEMAGTISSFIVRSDDRVLAATNIPCIEDFELDADASLPDKGCVRVSPTGAENTWVTPAVEPKVGCFGEDAANRLFACAHNWDPDNFAFGYSEDNGDSWTKLMRFSEITGPFDCPAETIQHSCEQLQWPSLCVMLGICEPPTGADAGMNVGPDAGGSDDGGGTGSCLGCQASGRGSLSSLLLLGAFAWAFRSSRRDRQSPSHPNA
jgi:hypothetical protein